MKTTPVTPRKSTSEFSITAALNKKEETVTQEVKIKEEELPDHHFTEKDLQTEWKLFLEALLERDQVMYYAVNTVKINKKEEHLIRILYPSDSVKAEFEKIQTEFFNHFKRKVHNYKIQLEFEMDISLKKEILTKRKMFEKYVEINPVLKDLDELLKLDLT